MIKMIDILISFHIAIFVFIWMIWQQYIKNQQIIVLQNAITRTKMISWKVRVYKYNIT